MFDQRLQRDTFCSRHASQQEFQRHLRMPADSFSKLVSFVRDNLAVNQEMAGLRGGAIAPEIAVYACLRYLAGGSYSDIRFFLVSQLLCFIVLFGNVLMPLMHAQS